jgi:hypothetical protein
MAEGKDDLIADLLRMGIEFQKCEELADLVVSGDRVDLFDALRRMSLSQEVRGKVMGLKVNG